MAVDSGTEAVIVGRTKQGFVSPDWLFASRPVRIFLALPFAGMHHPNYYFAERMIQGLRVAGITE